MSEWNNHRESARSSIDKAGITFSLYYRPGGGVDKIGLDVSGDWENRDVYKPLCVFCKSNGWFLFSYSTDTIFPYFLREKLIFMERWKKKDMDKGLKFKDVVISPEHRSKLWRYVELQRQIDPLWKEWSDLSYELGSAFAGDDRFRDGIQTGDTVV